MFWTCWTCSHVRCCVLPNFVLNNTFKLQFLHKSSIFCYMKMLVFFKNCYSYGKSTSNIDYILFKLKHSQISVLYTSIRISFLLFGFFFPLPSFSGVYSHLALQHLWSSVVAAAAEVQVLSLLLLSKAVPLWSELLQALYFSPVK